MTELIAAAALSLIGFAVGWIMHASRYDRDIRFIAGHVAERLLVLTANDVASIKPLFASTPADVLATASTLIKIRARAALAYARGEEPPK